MYKLLKADFYRLKKDIMFWLFIFLSIGIAIFMLKSSNVSMERLINQYLTFIGLLISIFVSIFVGKEYSDGILRNKVIVRS